MKSLKFFALFFFLGLFVLETTSCNKQNKVNEQYLGEYNGTIGYPNPQDPIQTIYEDGATLLVEKQSKNKYKMSSPTHPDHFPETVYVINKLLSNVDTAGQVGIEEGQLGSTGTFVFSDDADSTYIFVSRGDVDMQVIFTGSKPN
ncbi:MAG TPA: hypothetical protein ENJ88_02540 [Phaeodactylibacter sp.]|nr:hypothetical protein [Phaeodactylibacter sp.]